MYRLIGFLYLISGAWCATYPEKSAAFLGFDLLNPSALAEFFSVYGGLQLGIGAAIVLTSFNRAYLEASLFFAALVSSGLLLMRCISVVIYSSENGILFMAALEGAIALVLWLLWLRKSGSQIH